MHFMFKNHPAALIFTLLINLMIIKPVIDRTTMSTSLIGPYETDQEANINITLHVKIQKPSKYDFRIKYKNGETYETTYRHRISVTESKDYSFVAPFPTYVIKPNNVHNFRFDVTDINTNGSISSVIFSLDTKDKETIIINDLENKKYTGVNRSLKIIKNKVQYYRDNFDFKDMNTYLFSNYYHKLELEDLSFYSFSNIELGAGYITFYDRNNVFPYLRKIRSNTVIKCGIERKSDTSHYKIIFLDNLYVNPKTLEMSYLAKDGFDATNQIFLPHNKSKKFDNTMIHIYLNDMGRNHNDYRLDAQYSFNTKLMGDCHDSNYCIVGEKA